MINEQNRNVCGVYGIVRSVKRTHGTFTSLKSYKFNRDWTRGINLESELCGAYALASVFFSFVTVYISLTRTGWMWTSLYLLSFLLTSVFLLVTIMLYVSFSMRVND